MPAFFAAQSRALLAHAACIAIKDTDNRVASKGSATFVLHEDKRLIFTAEHVVSAREQADESQPALLLRSRSPTRSMAIAASLGLSISATATTSW